MLTINVLTIWRVSLPKPSLHHIGLHRVDSQLVMVCDGDAPAALLIQEGVGRLRAFRSAVNAAERAGPHIPVAKKMLIYLFKGN